MKRKKYLAFLWVAEWFGNNITVVNTSNQSVVNQFSLVDR
jgi:hypothetical protein